MPVDEGAVGTEDTGPEPVITLDLGEQNGGARPFYTVEDLQSWVESEVDHWNWIHGQIQGTNQLWSALTNLKNQIERHAPASDGKVQNAGPIRSSAHTLYHQHRMRVASTPEAHFLDELREEEGPHTAAGALQYLTANTGAADLNDRKVFQGFVLAELWRSGLHQRTGSEQEALRTLRSDWAEEFEREKARVLGTVELAESRVSDAEKGLTDFRRVFARKIRSMRRARSNALEQTQDRLEGLEKFYKEELSLRSPIDYWTDKADEYDTAAKRYRQWTPPLMAVVAVALVWGTATLIDDQSPEWWQFAAIGVVAALSFWIIRIAVRLLLSYQHLATDAAERVVMTKTFLALMEHPNSGITDEDRRHILQALFRPSATGIVRDDAAPPGVLEVITRQVSN